MISALKIRQRKFNFGQVLEDKGTANLPLARKLGEIPPASEFYREICLFFSEKTVDKLTVHRYNNRAALNGL